jgi:hypothetical protein
MANASVLEVPATKSSASVRSAGNDTTFPNKGVSKEEPKTAAEVNAALGREAEVKRAAVIKKLTSAWTGAVGKTVDGTLRSAAIVAEAKAELNPLSLVVDLYEKFIREVCRISIRTADRYIMIDGAFGVNSPLKKYKDQLPPDWTKMCQLSRFTAADNLTPKKAESLFLEALDFITTTDDPTKCTFPTSIEINTKVNELLSIKPKEKLFRQDKLVTNVPPPPDEAVEGEEVSAIPDAITRQTVNRAATAPLGTSAAPVDTVHTFQNAAHKDQIEIESASEIMQKWEQEKQDGLRSRILSAICSVLAEYSSDHLKVKVIVEDMPALNTHPRLRKIVG